nr:hypothetical protein Itr_chr08CG10850 [Ipomoea trifida]
MAASAVTMGAATERGVGLSCHICLAIVSGGDVWRRRGWLVWRRRGWLLRRSLLWRRRGRRLNDKEEMVGGGRGWLLWVAMGYFCGTHREWVSQKLIYYFNI